MIKKFLDILNQKIIIPIKNSHAPANEIALGTAIGLFWAINPLVGIQMYLVTINWMVLRLFKIRFNLPIALAMVWITNPITMPFFYYLFYITGIYFLKLFNFHYQIISFNYTKNILQQTSEMSFTKGLISWMNFLVSDFGVPALIGGFIWAVPTAIWGYFYSIKFITHHRKKLAEKENLTLEEWEKKHIHSFTEILKMNQEKELIKKD